jgi:hypothetical protein
MALPKISDKRFTYADYRNWPDDERWELIDGEAYAMAPAPTISHQTLAGQLFRQIDEALDGAPCRALIAPVDVLLPAADEATIVAPPSSSPTSSSSATRPNSPSATCAALRTGSSRCSPRHRPPRPPDQARPLRARRRPRILAGSPGRPHHYGLHAERRPIRRPGNRRDGRRTRADDFPGDRHSLAADSRQVAGWRGARR